MYYSTRPGALASPLRAIGAKVTAEALDRWVLAQRPYQKVPGLVVEANVMSSTIRGGLGFQFDPGRMLEFKAFVAGVEAALGLAETPEAPRPAKAAK